jgi:hypothetical protein
MLLYVAGGILLYFLLNSESSANTEIEPEKPKNLDIGPTTNPNSQFDKIYQSIASQYGVPWFYLKSIAGIESDFGNSNWYKNKTVINTKRGLMGVSEGTFLSVNKILGRNWSLNDAWRPEVSIEIAAYLLQSIAKSISKKSNFLEPYQNPMHANPEEFDTIKKIIQAYNIGTGNLSNPKFTNQANQYFLSFSTKLAQILPSVLPKNLTIQGYKIVN